VANDRGAGLEERAWDFYFLLCFAQSAGTSGLTLLSEGASDLWLWSGCSSIIAVRGPNDGTAWLLVR